MLLNRLLEMIYSLVDKYGDTWCIHDCMYVTEGLPILAQIRFNGAWSCEQAGWHRPPLTRCDHMGALLQRFNHSDSMNHFESVCVHSHLSEALELCKERTRKSSRRGGHSLSSPYILISVLFVGR